MQTLAASPAQVSPAHDRESISRAIIAAMAGRVPAALSATLSVETPLLTSGILDSIGVLDLMMDLERSFGITLDDADFEADNLETVGAVVRFVERKLQR